MIYMLQWRKSTNPANTFLSYYAIALGDMEDDGLSIVYSIERNEIIFVPRYTDWDTEEWGKVETYERRINEYLNRKDIKAIRYKLDPSGKDPMKLIDPYTTEIAIESELLKENLSEYLKRDGKIVIADSIASNLHETFYSDNKIKKEDLKIIPWEPSL